MSKAISSHNFVCKNERVHSKRVLGLDFCPVASVFSQDYLLLPESVVLTSGADFACGMFGSVDDNDAEILEELEFYQISLSTNDIAIIATGLSVANIFIEDNDGRLGKVI